MIPLMRLEFIQQQGWLTVGEFLDIMAIAEMTPGPIAVNTATFIGFQIAGFWGALVATAGVVSPSVIILLLIIYLSKKLRTFPLREALFKGIRPAVISLIAMAALYLGEQVIQDFYTGAFFVGALALVLTTRLSPLVIILLAGSSSIIVNHLLGAGN